MATAQVSTHKGWRYWINPINWYRHMRRRKKFNTTFDYLYKACKWFIFNAAFGLFPLLLMGIVMWLTGGKEGQSEVDKLIYEGGVLLFVLTAMMGAVAVDYLLSGFKFSSKEIFLFFIFPSLVTGFISLEFLLVCMGKLCKYALAIKAKKTITLMIISFIYCTLTKATFFLKEDTLK